MSFSQPQETYRKPITESSQDKTTSSSVHSEISLPDKLKPIPVESIILFQKQQKKKSFVQKLFSCFYVEEEQVKKPIKQETPKPIQQVILPETGQPPKGIAPWERSGKKPRKGPSVSQGTAVSSKQSTTENESTKSGTSSKSGGSSAAPWQSGLRKKNRRIDADESYNSFSIPDELLQHTKVPMNGNSAVEVKTAYGQEKNCNPNSGPIFSATQNTKEADTSIPISTKTIPINEESNGNKVAPSSPPPPPPPIRTNNNTTSGAANSPPPPPPPLKGNNLQTGTKGAPIPPPPPPPSTTKRT